MSRTHDVTISAFDLDRLERELASLTEQRDRLAEAIRKHRDELKLTSGDSVDRILWNVLDAVEGGSDE
jgi:hypothetical protein